MLRKLQVIIELRTLAQPRSNLEAAPSHAQHSAYLVSPVGSRNSAKLKPTKNSVSTTSESHISLA